MFNYIRAYVKKDNHWSQEDVSTRMLNDLLSAYQNVRLVVTYDTENAERGIDLKKNRYAMSTADKTNDVLTWLTVVDIDHLVFDNTKVSFNEVRSVKHWNLFDLPVKVEGANAKFGEGQPIPVGMKTDLKITSTAEQSSEISTRNIAKNMLIAINGRICKIDYVNDDGYIIDAYNKTYDGGNILSAIDFTDVGGLTQVNINEDMVDVMIRTPLDIDLKRTRCTVDIPPEIDGNVTPILVMDGHLHALDGNYKRLGLDKMLININLELAVKRASRFKQYNHTFVDSANVRESGIDGSSFDPKAYLHQTDSFIAFVHTNELCIFKEPLQQTQTYGGYEHYRAPKGIIVSEEFEYMPHIYQEVSAEHLAINVDYNLMNTNFFRRDDFDFQSRFANNKHTMRKRTYKKAYAFEMYVF